MVGLTALRVSAASILTTFPMKNATQRRSTMFLRPRFRATPACTIIDVSHRLAGRYHNTGSRRPLGGPGASLRKFPVFGSLFGHVSALMACNRMLSFHYCLSHSAHNAPSSHCWGYKKPYSSPAQMKVQNEARLKCQLSSNHAGSNAYRHHH